MNPYNLGSLFISLIIFFAIGNITYIFGDPLTYNVIGETVKITDCDENAHGALNIPSNVSGKPVTSIGIEAFLFCSKLTRISIPESIISIEHAAFSYCDNLMSFEVAKANRNYSSEDGVLLNKNKTTLVQFPAGKSDHYKIPASVTSIEDRAFLFCWNLKSIEVDEENNKYSSNDGILFDKNKTRLVQFPCGKSGHCTIPRGVKSIGERAFYGCRKLTSITIPESVTSIGYRSFYGCRSLTRVTIPKSVNNIGSMAFDGCWSLKGIKVSEGKTEHPSVEGYISLNNVTIPENDKFIKRLPFDGSLNPSSPKNIKARKGNTKYSSMDGVLFDKNKKTLILFPAGKSGSYKIPESVSNIGVKAFWNCRLLTSVKIGNSVTNISYGSFAYCRSLTRFDVNAGNTEYSSEDGALFDKEKIRMIQFPTLKSGLYKLPESITIIEENAFSGCSNLTSLIIPDSVRIIGDGAFKGCSSLISVTMPKNMITIGNEVFFGCSNLTDITIPKSVKSIGYKSFYGCNNLTSVTIPESVKSIDRVAFDGCISLLNIIFEGDAPNFYKANIFSGTSENAKIIVNKYAKGFGKIFAGLPVHVVEKSKIKLFIESNYPLIISFRSKEGSSYAVEATGNLMLWSKIGMVKGTGNEVKFTDFRESIFQQQYYRVNLDE